MERRKKKQQEYIWSKKESGLRTEDVRDNTICGSGLRREAEPTRVGVSEYAAAGLEMGWESCAYKTWGQVQHGLR